MRKLQFEFLEKKDLLAGDVSVAVNGATLEVQGDREGNEFTVTDDGTNLVFDSSNTTFNDGQSSVSIPKGAIDLLMADLGAGSDRLSFTMVAAEMDIYVDTGGGAWATGGEGVQISFSSIVGDITVVGGGSADVFGLLFSTVDGNLDVRLGANHDHAALARSNVTGNILVDAGQGGGHAPDDLRLQFMTVGGNVSVMAGQGEDVVTLIGTLTIGGDLDIDGGQGQKDRFLDSSTLVVGGDKTIAGFEIFI